MSEDERLSRLGLLHLKDKPEELKRVLEERRAARRRLEEASERQRIAAIEEESGAGDVPGEAED